MIVTLRDREGQSQAVDGRQLTEAEIRQGVIAQATILGSYGYYIEDEVKRCLADRSGCRAYLDFSKHDDGLLRVYYYSSPTSPR